MMSGKRSRFKKTLAVDGNRTFVLFFERVVAFLQDLPFVFG
jgi:hypothetical protein